MVKKLINLISGGNIELGTIALIVFFVIAPQAINHYSAALLNLVQAANIVRNWFK